MCGGSRFEHGEMTAVDECQIVGRVTFQVICMVQHRKTLAKHRPLDADQVFQIGLRPRATRTVLHEPHHCCDAHAADGWRRIGAERPRADPRHECWTCLLYTYTRKQD